MTTLMVGREKVDAYFLWSFDPQDAVSVPTDCDFQKLRVSKYKVISDITGTRKELDTPVYEANKPIYGSDENDYLDDEDDYLDEDDTILTILTKGMTLMKTIQMTLTWIKQKKKKMLTFVLW